jgi:predicted nucleotide-binding protein
MKVDEAKRILTQSSFKIAEEGRLPNNTGTKIRLDNGAIVNVWDKGTYNVQGRNTDAVKAVLEQAEQGDIGPPGTQLANKNVFVVYGHDLDVRHQLEAMLRRWGLEPLILDQLPSEGQTIIEKLESYTSEVNFAVVLATPDDEGHRAAHPDEKAYRARQNVVLELGMLLSKLGRKKVAILLKDQENMERPSDIQGLIYIPFKDSLKDAGLLLAKEMCAQGYQIDVAKL